VYVELQRNPSVKLNIFAAGQFRIREKVPSLPAKQVFWLSSFHRQGCPTHPYGGNGPQPSNQRHWADWSIEHGVERM
jgi:hypothetical protein